MTSFAEMKIAAKAQLSDKWWETVGVLFVSQLILGVIGVFSIVLAGVLEFGVVIYMLATVRGNKTEFGQMFGGFSRFGDTCLAGVLVSVFVSLWSLLFLIPGIVMSYAYSMTFYIMHDDPTLTASQAIAESKRMMKGYKGKLFLLELSFIGWRILDLLTFGILGILYVTPYVEATRANFYEQLRFENPAPSASFAPPPVPPAPEQHEVPPVDPPTEA